MGWGGLEEEDEQKQQQKWLTIYHIIQSFISSVIYYHTITNLF